MRRKLEAVKRELRAGSGVDVEQYQSLLNVRGQVNERYAEAIEWLRHSGREDEAPRFELMQKDLAPVKTENQLIADALAGRGEGRSKNIHEQGRGR